MSNDSTMASATSAVNQETEINNLSSSLQKERDDEPLFLFQESNSASAPILAEYANECAKGFNVPRSMVEAAILTIVSAAIGTKVHVKSGVHYTNLSIWMCLVAISGGGKTPMLKELMKPMDQREKERFDDYQRIEASENREPDPCDMNHAYVSDYTPESLCINLLHSPNGLLFFRDELDGWFRDFGRYHNSGEVQTLLSIFSESPINVSRKTTSPIFVEKPFLSLLGGIQPPLLHKTFGKEEYIDSGFTARFLFCYPQMEIPEILVETDISKELRNQWHEILNRLYSLNTFDLSLSSDAHYVKSIFFTSNQRKMKKAIEDKDYFESALYGKFVNYADRIAGIIYLIRFYSRTPFSPEIDEESYRRAVKALAKFEEWGLRVRNTIISSSSPKPPSQKDAILQLHRVCPIMNQSKFAEAIEKSQQYVNNILRYAT